MSDYNLQQEVSDKYSLRGRVFHKIREDILNGKYKQNEELREATIGAELGVSRTPVREAFRQLELEGLLKMIPNKGTYVTGITRKDVHDIYMIRSLLEGLCARWATEKITPEQLNEMEENVYLSEFHESKGHSDQMAELDNRFHEILYRIRRMTLASEKRGRASNKEHHEIMEAIKAHDADKAERLANLHMINAYDNMVKNGLIDIFDENDEEKGEQEHE